MNFFPSDPIPLPISHSTPDGFVFYTLPLQPARPAPLLILLTMDGKNTLIQDPYRRVGLLLHGLGWNVASLDLPCHGADRRPGEPPEIQGWAARSKAGEDWLGPFVERVRSVVSHLTQTGIADPAQMAAAGTSRGGFLAFQAAARIPALRAVAAFAPVTELPALREFGPLADSPLVQDMSLIRQAGALAGRPVWIRIGHDDDRVGTDRSVAFAAALEHAAKERGLAPAVTLQVLPFPGHRSFPEWHDDAAVWFQTVMNIPRT